MTTKAPGIDWPVVPDGVPFEVTRNESTPEQWDVWVNGRWSTCFFEDDPGSVDQAKEYVREEFTFRAALIRGKML